MVSPFDDGGTQPAYLIVLNNRQWKVSEVIYRILSSIDGSRTLADISEFLKESFDLRIEEQKLARLIDLTLVRNGILEGTSSETGPLRNRMMWGKITFLKPGTIEKLSILTFLFRTGVLLALGISSLVWLLYIMTAYSSSGVIRSMFKLGPLDLSLCYLFLVLAGLVHEFGHSIAAMTYGVKPGRIGAAVYFIMPVMFSDVTRIWGIRRGQRVIVDIGGMYLQTVFLGVCYLLNVLWLDSHILNLAILLSGFTVMGNLNPFIKFDGYWMLVDYLGVTDVKSVMGRLWSGLLRRLLRRPAKPLELSPVKQVVLYLYSIVTAAFMIYFIRFLGESLLVAIRIMSADVKMLYQLPVSQYHITAAGVLRYLSSRITSWIALYFFGSILWRYALRRLFIRQRAAGAGQQVRNVREEARYGAD